MRTTLGILNDFQKPVRLDAAAMTVIYPERKKSRDGVRTTLTAAILSGVEVDDRVVFYSTDAPNRGLFTLDMHVRICTACKTRMVVPPDEQREVVTTDKEGKPATRSVNIGVYECPRCAAREDRAPIMAAKGYQFLGGEPGRGPVFRPGDAACEAAMKSVVVKHLTERAIVPADSLIPWRDCLRLMKAVDILPTAQQRIEQLIGPEYPLRAYTAPVNGKVTSAGVSDGVPSLTVGRRRVVWPRGYRLLVDKGDMVTPVTKLVEIDPVTELKCRYEAIFSGLVIGARQPQDKNLVDYRVHPQELLYVSLAIAPRMKGEDVALFIAPQMRSAVVDLAKADGDSIVADSLQMEWFDAWCADCRAAPVRAVTRMRGRVPARFRHKEVCVADLWEEVVQ